jgi:hypothetical protein
MRNFIKYLKSLIRKEDILPGSSNIFKDNEDSIRHDLELFVSKYITTYDFLKENPTINNNIEQKSIFWKKEIWDSFPTSTRIYLHSYDKLTRVSKEDNFYRLFISCTKSKMKNEHSYFIRYTLKENDPRLLSIIRDRKINSII